MEDGFIKNGELSAPKRDGGPAFAASHTASFYECRFEGVRKPEHVVQFNSGGMSLRDYFAAQVLPGLVSAQAAQDICDNDPRYDGSNFAKVVALNAYEFADAMLKARDVS